MVILQRRRRYHCRRMSRRLDGRLGEFLPAMDPPLRIDPRKRGDLFDGKDLLVFLSCLNSVKAADSFARDRASSF
jgi:hypothetical protein